VPTPPWHPAAHDRSVTARTCTKLCAAAKGTYNAATHRQDPCRGPRCQDRRRGKAPHVSHQDHRRLRHSAGVPPHSAEHWNLLHTTKPIEPTFATARPCNSVTKGPGSPLRPQRSRETPDPQVLTISREFLKSRKDMYRASMVPTPSRACSVRNPREGSTNSGAAKGSPAECNSSQ